MALMSHPGSDSVVSQASGTVDIGDGRKLYVKCAGTGSPTIISRVTSGGGYLAANYTLDHPEEVPGLMLLDTLPALDTKTAPRISSAS